MSEFTNNQKIRLEKLESLFNTLIHRKATKEYIESNQNLIDSIIPEDIIFVVHELVNQEIETEKLKTGINKALNVLFKTLSNHPYQAPEKESFLHIMLQNNVVIDSLLKDLKPLIRQINKDCSDLEIRNNIIQKFTELSKIGDYYAIKENVLFPLLEQKWEEFKCLQIMWSYHDDIRKGIKSIINELESSELDIVELNILFGEVFFDIYAIKFREERILFPYIQQTLNQEEVDALFIASDEIGFPYIKPDLKDEVIKIKTNNLPEDIVDLKSGNISVDQLIMIFNHLPVDITFVDENDKVKFYSTPKHRIFPRTNAIIGRDVKNCHPPESVHIVEKIVAAFKANEKSKASFWIRMKGQFILIQYFALRDDNNKYKGVIEVSQEVSEIRALEGENRLLDWD